jgi:hypothetical protein
MAWSLTTPKTNLPSEKCFAKERTESSDTMPTGVAEK